MMVVDVLYAYCPKCGQMHLMRQSWHGSSPPGAIRCGIADCDGLVGFRDFMFAFRSNATDRKRRHFYDNHLRVRLSKAASAAGS